MVLLTLGLNVVQYRHGRFQKKTPLRPSYEDGELRDESIEKKQQASLQPKDLLRLIKKAMKKAPKGT